MSEQIFSFQHLDLKNTSTYNLMCLAGMLVVSGSETRIACYASSLRQGNIEDLITAFCFRCPGLVICRFRISEH